MTQIRMVDLAQRPTAVVAQKVPRDRLPEFFEHAFTAVMSVTGTQGVLVTGPPFAHYLGVPTGTVDVEAGFPTASVIEVQDDVRPGVIPTCRAIEALHVGPYETLAQTYGEAMQWASEQGVQPGHDMWEEYLSDPTVDSDPATWRTRVLVPVT